MHVILNVCVWQRAPWHVNIVVHWKWGEIRRHIFVCAICTWLGNMIYAVAFGIYSIKIYATCVVCVCVCRWLLHMTAKWNRLRSLPFFMSIRDSELCITSLFVHIDVPGPFVCIQRNIIHNNEVRWEWRQSQRGGRSRRCSRKTGRMQREEIKRRARKKKKRNSHGCISMFCMYIPLVSMRSDALPCAMCTVCWIVGP